MITALPGPTPVKYFMAVLHAGNTGVELLRNSEWANAAQLHWGEIDYLGSAYPFDQTQYYQAEMGDDLYRTILSFTQLRSPEELASGKLRCIEIEAAHALEGRRTVNLDIGYLDHAKIVLASVKGLSQKIYLSQGVYADLVARYSQGRYQPFEWTFPDFKAGRYDTDLTALRKLYLEQLKSLRSP